MTGDTNMKKENTINQEQEEMVFAEAPAQVIFNEKKEPDDIVEEDAEYTIIVNIAFEKSNLAQSTVNVNANGENMAVIQTNGTDGNWITQKLCKVKLDKGAYNIKLEDVLAGIKVKYMQFKKLKRK